MRRMSAIGRFRSVRSTAQKLPVGFEERSVRRQRLNVATWWGANVAALPRELHVGWGYGRQKHERPNVSLKRGCMASAGIGFALLLLLLWPYRLETVESTMSANETGCVISTTSNGGWRERIGVSRVAYPLDIRVFVGDCAGTLEGRPYSATLLSIQSGKVVASGRSCSEGEHADRYPCRLELPPLNTLTGQDRFRVRVTRNKGQDGGVAELRLFLKREWRSGVIDGIISV